MEIKFKIVDGEPFCDVEHCPSSYINDVDCEHMCALQAPGNFSLDNYTWTCIPGLREQRDEAKSDYEDLKKVDAKLVQEIGVAHSERDTIKGELEKAKDCIEDNTTVIAHLYYVIKQGEDCRCSICVDEAPE